MDIVSTKNDQQIETALTARFAVLSVFGGYAGESKTKILERKQRESSQTGYTFWRHQSSAATPEAVQGFVAARAKKAPTYLILIGPASKAMDTQMGDAYATHYREAEDGPLLEIPKQICVAGWGRPYALKIGRLVLPVEPRYIDLRYYEGSSRGEAVTLRLGASTVCTERKTQALPGGMQSHLRRIVAVAELLSPYSVWVDVVGEPRRCPAR